MKKLLIAAIAALFTVSAATAEAPKFYLDTGFQIPVMGNLDIPDGVDQDITQSFGLDVSFRAMFTEKIGLAANVGIFCPMEEKIETKLADIKFTQDDFDEWYGFDGLFGVAIKPVNKEKFGLTIIPGFAFMTEHTKFSFGGASTTSDSTLFGAGVDIDFDIYLGDHFYLKPSIETTVFFAGDSELYNESTSYFCMTPAFAVGWRF